MNAYLVFIVTFLVAVYFLDTLTDLLNLGHLKGTLPQEFVGLYDEKKYQDSLRYQKEGTRFGMISRSLSIIISLTFILLGGFNWVDQIARSFNLGSISTGLVYIGLLSAMKMVIDLPFSIYDTFVIEAKYGFNRTTPATFIGDLMKGIVLSAILGGIVFSGIVYFFEKAGPSGWWMSWLGITAFQIILLYLAPAVIMPLFNKFTPLPDGDLKQAIEAYARTRNFRLNGIFTMDSSKRSTKSNAFFTGFGKFRRLVLFDTLVSKHSIDELVAVLAHEIGHFELKHIIRSLILSIFTTGIMFFTIGLFINNPSLFEAFKMDQLSVYASLVFVGFIYSPILRVLSLFTQYLSRKHEFEADDFAVRTYGKADDLISALKKLSIDNLSHLTPHPLKVMLDYTHPPILERIHVLQKKKSST